MHQMIRIQQCPGGLVHLSIGAMTVRLEPTSFLAVAAVIQGAAARLAATSRASEAQLTIVNGRKS